jgi:hypothetical protein
VNYINRIIIWLVTVFLTGTAFSASETEFEVVIWNQHNGNIHDRGSKTCTVEVFKGTTSLWKREKVELAWSADSDVKTSVSIPRLSFSPDRVRITITEWIGSGGGLAEVELLRDGENFARQCKVSGSAMYDHRFKPELVIDGINTSANNFIGYWLLPDKTKGWVDLQFPQR